MNRCSKENQEIIEKDTSRTFGGVFKLRSTQRYFQKKLEYVLKLLFAKVPDWHYYQGFNTIGAVSVLCFERNYEAVYFLYRLGSFFFRDFLTSSFESRRLELTEWTQRELTHLSPFEVPEDLLFYISVCELISPVPQNLAHLFLPRFPDKGINRLTDSLLGVSHPGET